MASDIGGATSPKIAPPVEALTNCPILARRAASSRRNVPSALSAKQRAGSAIESMTPDIAARWTTASIPTMHRLNVGPSRKSPRQNFTADGNLGNFCPAERLSSTTTSCPNPAKCGTRFEPIKPAPPVTSIFIIHPRRSIYQRETHGILARSQRFAYLRAISPISSSKPASSVIGFSPRPTNP